VDGFATLLESSFDRTRPAFTLGGKAFPTPAYGIGCALTGNEPGVSSGWTTHPRDGSSGTKQVQRFDDALRFSRRNCLVDGRARTSTELAVVAEVTPSTASAHLQRLTALRLVKVVAQGRHRYYSLDRPEVATVLEALNVLAACAPSFIPKHASSPAQRTNLL
jgi:DNA-binding transcriptional ArsR family regulator